MNRKHLVERVLPPLLIILAGVLAYWNSFDGVFLYDDITAIRDNPHIRVLWPISEAMSLPLWNTAFTVDGRPLLSLSFALNHALFGPEPWGYHLVNLLIHICAGLLLFGIVRRTIRCQGAGVRGQGGHETGVALAVALIWLVHPLQTGSVTYIVQRAESLMGMLFLMTLYCAIRGMTNAECGMGNAEGEGEIEQKATKGEGPRPADRTAECRPSHDFRSQVCRFAANARLANWPMSCAGFRFSSRAWQITAVICCAVGMGVKEIIFSAPILVLLYDWVFISQSLGKALSKRRWLYAGLFSTWTIVFATKYLAWSGETSYFAGISPLRYALTQPMVLLHYLRLTVWPDPLVLAYGWQLETQWPRIVFPGLVILVTLGVMLRGLWRRRWYGFLLAWFFLILAPTSSIAPMRQPIFEHRMYLSLAALAVFAVIGVDHSLRRICGAPRQRFALGFSLVLAVALALGCRTRARNSDYHDAIHFWKDNVAHRPDHPLAHLNLGCAIEEEGSPGDALVHYQQAVALKPDYAEAHYNWGVALDRMDRRADSIGHYQQALRIKPDYAEAHNNMAHALKEMGRPEEAVEHCLAALRINPNMAKAHNNLGNAVMMIGRPDDAISHYRKALSFDPGSAQTHHNIGIALDAVGRPSEAVTHYKEATRLQPDLIGARYNLANNLLSLGQHSEAVAHYELVVRADPTHADAHNNWALALYALGRIEEAIVHGRRAVEIARDHAGAHNNLGSLYRESGRLGQAITHFERAVLLQPDNALAQQNLLETRKMMQD